MAVSRMKSKAVLSFLGGLCLMTRLADSAEEPKGIIGRAYEDGNPVIYRFVNEKPSAEIRAELRWLTIIVWPYEGARNNGMPASTANDQMVRLEDALTGIEEEGVLRHAFSRTGNNLKELGYYIHDRQLFLEAFNGAVRNHPRYPIEINFYEDPEWKELQRLLDDFAGAANKAL